MVTAERIPPHALDEPDAGVGLDPGRLRPAAGLLAVAGCALDKPQNQPRQVFNRIGGHGGQIIEPRRCLIRVAIIDRPFRDPAINEAVWRVADEQVVSPAERKALEANGLRIGRIIGELPREIESILKEEGPDRRRSSP